MKKSLLALAVLGAFAGAASAQTNVTLYGVVDLGLNTSTFDQTGLGEVVDTRGLNSIMSVSRIGFRGTEDLGGGLKANFLLEYAVAPDEATTSMANRQSFVGLSGNLGALTLGRVYSLIHGVQGMVDPGGNATAAGWIGVHTSAVAGVRQSNAITYTSPGFGGFSVSLQKGFGEDNAADGTRNAEQVSIGANYRGGPIAVGLAYERVSDLTAGAFRPVGIGSAAAGDPVVTPALGAVGANDKTAWSLGATYDFGMAKVGYLYTRAAFDPVAAGAVDLEWANHNVGVTVPFGAVTAFASYGVADVDQGPQVGEADGWQIGALYALSKRTNLYTIFGNATQETTAAPRVEVENQTFAVGVRHTF